MGLLRGCAAIGVALTLSGCWLQPGFDARNSRANPFESTLTSANVATLHEVWTTTTSVSGTPLIASGRVLVGGMTDDVTVVEAYDLATGSPVWSENGDAVFPEYGIAAGPTIAGDQVWMGGFPDPAPNFATNFTAFDVGDGTPTSTLQVNGLGSYPVAAGDLVVQTTSMPGLLIVRDRATMAELWTAAVPNPDFTSPGTPVVAGGHIYVSSELRLQAYPTGGCGAPTCSPTWSVDLATHDPNVTSETLTVVAATAADEALVTHRYTYTDPYTGNVSHHGSLYAITSDGTTAWTATVGYLESLAVAGNTVYVSGYEMVGPEFEPPFRVDYMHAIEGGTVVWRGSSSATSQLAVAGGVLYRGVRGTVEAYDLAGCGATTCPPLTTVTVDGAAVRLSVAAGRLLVSSNDNGVRHLTAFAPS